MTTSPLLAHPLARLRRPFLAAALGLALTALAGCAGVYRPGGASINSSTRLDDTPRIAVMSAFEPELKLLLTRLQGPAKHSVNGVEFTTGTLEGKPVVLFLSGISMTNATMNTQLVLNRFRVTNIVFSGIAGGVNPQLHVGDVTVPAQWGQYLEVLMARETAPGKFAAPPFITDATLPNFGMMFPRPVEVRSAAGTSCRSWARKPQLVVGGNGVSGQAFMDNKAYREYTYKTFQANVLDMETAAVGMVAYSNGVPYIAFRSLSDLAGGGDGENEMGTFMSIAADNSAKVMLAFLAAWK
jgi:adenosylhomocysteine nucleosidase